MQVFSKSITSKSISETVEANDIVFEAPVLSVTFELFTSILELVFSLNVLMQHFFLGIFPKSKHSPLLFVADWYRFNLFCDFDTSQPDFYINIDGT